MLNVVQRLNLMQIAVVRLIGKRFIGRWKKRMPRSITESDIICKTQNLRRSFLRTINRSITVKLVVWLQKRLLRLERKRLMKNMMEIFAPHLNKASLKSTALFQISKNLMRRKVGIRLLRLNFRLSYHALMRWIVSLFLLMVMIWHWDVTIVVMCLLSSEVSSISYIVRMVFYVRIVDLIPLLIIIWMVILRHVR